MASPTLARRIPLLDIRAQIAPIRREVEAAIGRVLDHAQFILGPEVRELEEAVARYCHCRHAIACASGSDALLLSLAALDVKAGDRVVTTPYTFFATAGAIVRLGATPVFVDIDPLTYNVDPEQLETTLGSLRPGELESVKAIIPVHLFGQCADMAPIADLAASYGVPVIEDAAQAIGAEYRGRRAGSMGTLGCFSFFPSKNLGGFGDGGAITTDDDALADKLRVLRVHGARPKYHHKLVGVNSRLDTLQAAVLLVKLGYLDEWAEARRRNAAWYCDILCEAPVALPVEAAGCRHIYNQFVIRTPRRDSLMAVLKDAGIGCEVYYPVPLHLQECFQALGYREGDLPESEAAARETLAIPVQPELEPAALEGIAQVILDDRY